MRYVAPDEVIDIWETVGPWLQSANQYAGGKLTLEDYLVKILTGQADLWTNGKIAILAEPSAYPRKRVYTLLLAGGEHGANWGEVARLMEDVAKMKKCQSIEVFGRPGWKRILGAEGYDVAHFVYRKEL